MNNIKLDIYKVRIAFKDGNVTYRIVTAQDATAAVEEVNNDYAKAGALDLVNYINIKYEGK